MRGWILRWDPVLIDDGDLKKVHLVISSLRPSRQLTLTFGVMTTMVLVLTSIHSFLSNVSGSLAIMMILSRLSALVIRYRPPSWYSSNEVPDEKKREEASDVREVMYRVAITESPSLTTKLSRLGPV